jgi:transcription elongation factor Elf1
MDLIDSKYIGLVSIRLQKFKRVKADLYNFRCPICNDSQKNKNKTRGYLYAVKNNTNYKCHNCGVSLSFNNFLKKVDPNLHSQYTLEKFKGGFTGKNFVVEEPKFDFKKPTFTKKLNLPKASENEDAKKYLEKRKLNPDRFFYAEKFKEWTNTQIKTFDSKSLYYEEPRIVIPLLTEDGNVFGFQGRAIGPSKVKYITILLDDTSPKVYGLDKINKKQTIYITEGPFDSEFVENAIAMCGADVDISSFGFKDIVYILDNEPRNKEICSRIKKLILNGEKVVIWPRSVNQKDINDMILTGLNVMDVIKSNTYKDLEATVKFNEWKKV